MSFLTLLRISRPRFWHYVLGPMLILFAILSQYTQDIIKKSMISSYQYIIEGEWMQSYNLMISSFQLPEVLTALILLCFFTFPANILIYGVNDIADNDTDKYNSKKLDYEAILPLQYKKKLLGVIVAIFTIAVIVTIRIIKLLQHIDITTISISFVFCLLPFLFFGIFYSIEPIRAKSKPFLDGLFNILYIAPAFSGYIYFSYYFDYPISLSSIYVFIASYLWTIALHCYSAIPDIEPDRKAGLTTTAIYLGKQNALIYCGILYFLSALLSFFTLGWFSVVGGIIYITMIIISFYKKDIFGIYKMFPYINLIIGFSLFRYIIFFL